MGFNSGQNQMLFLDFQHLILFFKLKTISNQNLGGDKALWRKS